MRKESENLKSAQAINGLTSIDRRIFIRFSASAAASLLSGCGGAGGVPTANPTPNTVNATLIVQRQQVAGSATLDSQFASLSYEKSHINTSPNIYFGPNSASTIGLLNALGGGVLRLGANSVDRMTWVPAGAGQTSGQISRVDIDHFANCMKQCPNWKVIYGINFAGAQGSTASPVLAASEAAYVAQQLGNQLLGFEIGNEPDLYGHSNTPNLAGMTYNIFLNGGTVSQGVISGWNQFAQAIRVAVPNASFSGPAAASDSKSWAENFSSSEAGNIALMTEHYYISNYNSAAPTISGMLTYPDPHLVTALQALQQSSQNNSVPFRIDECNSYFASKNPSGVSNAFAAALWAIDFIFTHAQYGASGLNFHNNGSIATYAALGDSGGAITAVQPLYYALLLFSQIFKGGQTGKLLNCTLSADSSIQLSAFAIESSNGATYIVVNNKDTVNAVSLHIAVGITASKATVMTLASSGADSNAQLANLGIYNGGGAITFGGQAVNLTGNWLGTSQQTLTVSGQSVVVSVAPVTAVLVKIL